MSKKDMMDNSRNRSYLQYIFFLFSATVSNVLRSKIQLYINALKSIDSIFSYCKIGLLYSYQPVDVFVK